MTLRSGVSPWTLLVFSVLLKNAQAGCDLPQNCAAETSLPTTNTTVSFDSQSNCSLSTDNNISGNGSITGLTPGAVYQISVQCLNCCKEVTTMPEKVNNLRVTGFTTSSIYLNWTKPEGNSSFYKVKWTDGTETKSENETETYINITNLTPGVEYTITVNAVADDRLTIGADATVFQYTKPEQVDNLKVTDFTTSSITLNWTKLNGNSSFYRVQWTDGYVTNSDNMTQKYINIMNLTAGVQYNITVAAVADDGLTEGANITVSQYTKPEVVRNLTVTKITTSSISLNWTEPDGNSSLYRVQWTGGEKKDSVDVSETFKVITNLTAGVQYAISVTAVANDGQTEGASVNVSQFTKPEVVRNLTVTEFTTSTITLNWTQPKENSSFFKVQWSDGNVTENANETETYIKITNLTAGVQYNINVTAVADDHVTEGASVTVSQYTKPEVVRNLSVTKITTSSISLNWTEPDGNSSLYRVQWTGGEINDSVDVSETFKVITNLTAGVQYTISVTAVADDGQTDGQSTTVYQYTKPEVVRNLTVTEFTTSTITLNWTKPKGNSSFFKVKWTDGNVTKSANETETYRNITNLTAGVHYTINVTAVADDHVTEGASVTVSQYTKPEVVRNLTVTKITSSSISLNWTKPDGNSSFYRVQWTGGEINDSVDVSETFKVITNLTAGVQYTISVTAVADDGQTEGQSTTVYQYTKPEVVRNLTVTEFTTSTITLNWTKPKENSSFYRIQWTDGNVSKNANETETYVKITNLTAGVHYTINVTAVADDHVTEGASVTVSQYTKPEVVRNLTVTKITTSSISLNWTEPDGNSSLYRVQWTGGEINDSVNVSETFKVITNLTAGVQYAISVTAVADDGQTEGQSTTVYQYTKPEVVRNLTVTEFTTSTITLNWTKPKENSSFFKVKWTDGNVTKSANETETYRNITNLTAGVQYKINVTAVADDHVTEGASVTVSQYTKPDVVRNLTVTKITTSSISLNWTEPDGNSSLYRVQWTGGEINDTVNVSDTFKVITNLTAGVQYTISVTAVADDGQTDGQSTTVYQYTKPGTIENLNKTISTTTISLTWTKPPGQVFDYKVEWNNGGTPMSTFTSNTTSAVLSDLIPGTKYTITVTAFAGDNKTEGDGQTLTTFTKPGTIENLDKTISTTTISLTWTKPPGQVFDYKVEWNNGGTPMSTFTSNMTSAVLSDLIPGTNYMITVTAFAGDNKTEGDGQTFTTFTKPEVVGNLTVNDYTTSSVSVNWTKPEGNSSFYRVQWTDGTETKSENVTETQKNITNLTPGVQYNISVTAVAHDGKTEGQSTAVYQYTKPGTIENPDKTTNTTSISLTWTKPPGQVFDYKVEWNNGRTSISTFTSNSTSAVLSDLIPGTNYTITITAFAGDNETTGEPLTFTSITKPAAVTDLTVTEVTTSSVLLNWTAPKADHYKIMWSTGESNFNNTTTETSFTIRDLNPGFEYIITVAAVAVAGELSNEGEGTSRTTFTRPEKPENIKVIPGTDSLTINWILPKGRVDHYVVNISNADLKYSNSTQATDNTTSFTDLYPGRIFAIIVTAVAGNFTNVSDTSSFATVPTPPGSIIISQPTISSLHVEWTTPARMEGAPNISYIITYQGNGSQIQSKESTDNSTELSPLLSGTSYDITVVTVGPQNLRSLAVPKSAFTLPNPVLNLEARPNSNTSVTVEWTDPLGVQPYYKYLVQTYNKTGVLVNSTSISNNSTNVTGLEPGSRYDINVTTIAASGIKSTVEQTFSYTRPKAVTNLEALDVSTTVIKLTWLRQSDHKPSYSYRVDVLHDDVVVYNISTTNETHTFSLLTPGNRYTFNVYTVVAGVESTRETIEIHTMPETVSSLTAIGTTTNLSVSWTPGSGHVSSYTVLLYRNSQLVRNATDLSNTTRNKLFVNLIPGVLYFVSLVSKSGNWSSTSNVSNATFPTPPGPITVESQTVDSINFTWPLPEGMDHNEYNFSVSSINVSATIQNSWFLLANLSSGSPHRISVVTVGVRNYESTAETAENYTRPYSVTNLRETQISTNEVTLAWNQPEIRSDYTYLVQASNGVFNSSKEELVNTSTISGLLSGSNFSFTVTTRTADGTEADPVTVSYFTRPYNISGLVAETLNSTAINLTWIKPLEYKMDYKYWIETTGCDSKNETQAGEIALISELTPGSNCTFCVSVLAANGIKGEKTCTSQYTKPESGKPSISSKGSNSSVLVSWTPPRGNVDVYEVFLNRTPNEKLTNETNETFLLFEDLSAGTLYSAVLITRSGPFNASSESVTNATFPNPPGSIEILRKTTSSIEFRWGEAPQMSGASFYYQVTNQPSQGGGNITTNTTTSTNQTFASLPSGTSFNISVVTVGVWSFESRTVYSDMVTTRPLSVKSLMGTQEEAIITVKWTEPDEYKESYRYNLTWQKSNENDSNSTELQTTEFSIEHLDPGSSYNISVTTVTSDGTTGAPKRISGCTKASPVIDLTCKGPDKTNAEVVLLWTKPNGQNSGFQIRVNNGEITHMNGTCCGHTVSHLRYNTEYNLTVETMSCGQSSNPVTIPCKTGITNPPISKSCNSLVIVKDVKHNRFSLEVDPSLLDNSHGPITSVGVLVTSSTTDDTSDLTQYLRKNYSEWKDGKTPVYLATVTYSIAKLRSEQDLIVIGNGSKWNGYTNDALNANEKYKYAIAIFTSLEIQQNFVDTGNSLVSVTDFCFDVELPTDPAVIGIAVGTTLGIFCVLFIVLIGFIIYWKRLSNKESSDIQIHSMRAKVSVPVRVEDYEAYYKKQKADSNCGFAEEFEDLKIVGTGQAKIHALTMENKPKNRYNNVLPYDSSRVKLSIIHGSPYDDYINANYMPGYLSRKEFIAAQGPLPATVSEFWRMIWEKNVQTVVMLTRCNEQGRVKCEQYWGSGIKHFENITVKTTSEIPLEDWTIRDFDIKNVKTAETRSIRHFHFTAWPDHGVPETTELLISFRHLVREHMNQYSRHSPTVVHCSAGVGRTGTFIAIDRLIFQIERENIVDVFGIVHDLRMHRPLMVQTEDQYVFLNQCALDVIRSRTGTNVDLIYQNTAALSIYENVEPKRGYSKNGYHNA